VIGGITTHCSRLEKENHVHNAPLSTVRQSPTSSPLTAGNRGCKSAGRRLRFNRTIGFWLGGIILGTAGCIIGASTPYHHPVAVTISALWWGIYFGGFGGSRGALIGLLTESTAAAPSQESGGTAKPPSEEDNGAFPDSGKAFVNGVPRKAKAVDHSQPADRALSEVEAR
jgi:hypothetical protein